MMRQGIVTIAALVTVWFVAGGATGARAAGVSAGFAEAGGRYPAEVRYAANLAEGTVFVTTRGLVFDLHGPRDADGAAPGHERHVALMVGFDGWGSGIDVAPAGEARPGLHRRFPAGERGVAARRAVEWRVFDAVTLRDGMRGGSLRLALRDGALWCGVEEPGVGDPGWRVPPVSARGADRVEPMPNGGIRFITTLGTLSWQPDLDGASGCFRWVAANEAGAAPAPGEVLAATTYDFVLGTYLGGAGSEQGTGAVAIAANGDLVVAGHTESADFPVSAGVHDVSYNGLGDAFVASFDSSAATLAWCTYIGGARWDQATCLSVGAAGELVVSGFTESPDFPVVLPAGGDSTLGGTRDGFVLALDHTGSTLLWSGYLGGAAVDEIRGAALSAGHLFVTGYTTSADFPVTPGAYRTLPSGSADAFVARIERTDGSLSKATYLGGSSSDRGLALAMQGSSPVIAGETLSISFPTTAGAWDRGYGGGGDAFACVFDSTLSVLGWSTFVGGADWDQAAALAIAPDGAPVIAGFTWSPDWPTSAGAWDRSLTGSRDGVIARLAPGGNTLEWSTFLGGGGNESCWGVAVDGRGNTVVTGETRSLNYPVTPSTFDNLFNGDWDAFITRFRPAGDSLSWSTFLGGERVDVGSALVLDLNGDPVVAGWTTSAGFPWTPGCYDSTRSGESDLFLVKFAVAGYTGVHAPPARGAVPPALRAVPNPFTLVTSVRMEHAASPAGARVDIFDAAGRRVRSLALPAGRGEEREVAWDGRDAHGRVVPPGIYLARLGGAGATPETKLVRLR